MESVDCEKAIRLAEQHSIAVDYPKTGMFCIEVRINFASFRIDV